MSTYKTSIIETSPVTNWFEDTDFFSFEPISLSRRSRYLDNPFLEDIYMSENASTSVENTDISYIELSFRNEKNLYEKLGNTCWGRFWFFHKHCSIKWGYNGTSISALSQISFLRFLDKIEINSRIKPYIFLTESGHIEVVLEKKKKDSLHLEFFPDKVEYYMELDDEEGELSNGSVIEFVGDYCKDI